MRNLITILVLASGCGATVRSSVAPNTNLAQYRTFSFYHSPQNVLTIADQAIESSLRERLMAKGMVEAPEGGSPPDFLVSYHVRLQQEVSGGPGYWPGYYGWGYYGNVYTYTVGTLIVDFIDARTQRAFWRGTASQVVNNPATPDTNKIEGAVTKLMNQYPLNLAATQRPAM
jgi:hypothetical protein